MSPFILAVLSLPLFAAAEPSPAVLGKPVAPEQLARARGGNSNTSQHGTVTGNSDAQGVRGNNVNHSGSFDDKGFIPVVVLDCDAKVWI